MVDFSNATFTKPSKTGTSLPAACSVGETYFKTDAAPGTNLYGCTSTDTWSQISGAGGDASSVQGNPVTADSPAAPGQFYGWNPGTGEFALFNFGSLLAVTGNDVNVAGESVVQYGHSLTVPSSCSQWGLLYFDSGGGDGQKLHYCNGSTFEPVTGNAARGLYSPFPYSNTGSALAAGASNLDRVLTFPFHVDGGGGRVVQEIAFRIHTASAGSTIGLALYDSTKNKIAEWPVQAGDSVGGYGISMPSEQTLAGGWYYLGIAFSDDTVAIRATSGPDEVWHVANQLTGVEAGYSNETVTWGAPEGSRFPASITILAEWGLSDPQIPVVFVRD